MTNNHFVPYPYFDLLCMLIFIKIKYVIHQRLHPIKQNCLFSKNVGKLKLFAK